VRTILDQVRRGEPTLPFETARLRKHGTRVEILLTPSPVKDENGVVIGVSGMSRDITARRQMEEQYRQLQKMEAIGQLAGGVAHDFNNLLTVINGCGELVLGRLPAGDPLRELIAEITRAGERAAALTRQLLAFSRRQVLDPKVLDLNAVLADLEKMLRRLIGEDVRLTTRLQPGLGRVKVDPAQIEQVILNLAINARDAMPRGGELIIETANIDLDGSYAKWHAEVHAGPYVRLRVCDTGQGMAEEVKRHIFEPFFTTKPPGKGTGLGLTTVYAFVEQSGGHIEVASEPGRGTAFMICLPCAEESGKPRSFAGTLRAPQGTETVLLVEDEPAVRALTRHVLQASGYTVLEASDGDEALHLAEQHSGSIHLLVTDVVLPALGGAQLGERLRIHRPELRVLFVSGYADDAIIRHGVRESEVDLLQKPFSPAVLAHKVREVLDRPR
jgi:signal transduction histidine kinase/CheY-like chemotaxis protein